MASRNVPITGTTRYAGPQVSIVRRPRYVHSQHDLAMPVDASWLQSVVSVVYFSPNVGPQNCSSGQWDGMMRWAFSTTHRPQRLHFMSAACI